MAFSQSQLDALEVAIASGTLSVRHGEKVHTYQNLSEMLKVRASMIQDISAAAKPDRSIPRFQVASFSDE